MDKRESPKKEGLAAPISNPKIPGLSSKAFGIIKFILGICLLPFVYSGTVSFLNEFSVIEKVLQNYFWAGVISFLIIYLFIWEPAKVYAKGQKILEMIFQFFSPLVKVAPYLLPIYFIIISIIYFPLTLVINSSRLVNSCMFLFGLFLSLHLVFSAKTLRAKQGDFLKSNYIFGFSFVYIINITMLAFSLNCIFKEFSFVNFFNNSYQIAVSMFGAVFKQLFIP